MRLIWMMALLGALALVSGCSVLEGTKLAPVAVIEVIPQKGSTPFDVTFSGVSSRDAYTDVISYAWDFGDGSTDDEAIVNHTYRQAGVFVVSLTVENSFGLSNTDRATVVVTRPPVPNAPAGLEVAAPSSRMIELSWIDRSTDEDGFQIERRDPDGVFVPIATTKPDEESYTDDLGLEPDARYCYRVRAFSELGSSEFTQDACITTPAGPVSFGERSDADENELVSVLRTVIDNGDQINVSVRVEAKAELELLAVVESLDSFVLLSGELTTFVVNLLPGESLTFDYVIADDALEDGGTVSGIIRAKPVDLDSVILNLESVLQR